MEQQFIQVNLKDKNSLKEAIFTFQSQLRHAYQTGELIHRVGGFISHDKKQFQPCDLFNPDQFKAIFLLRSDDELESEPVEALTDEALVRLSKDDAYLRFSHMVVFQHALEQEDLKPLIVAFCEELVEFSLRVNASNELFFSSSMLFGIYLLVLLAEKYPEYAYLIGEYYPEDSDFNQIMYHGADYMAYLFYQHGYSNLVLDAYASCHFDGMFGCIMTHYMESENFVPDLLNCFLADESRYQYYKEALIQSLKRRPRNIADDDPFVRMEHGFSQVSDAYDDDEEFADELISREEAEGEFDDLNFHGRTIAEEREVLRQAMYEAVKDVPLKDLWYYDQPVYDETTTLADIQDDPFYQEYDEYNEYETNKSFFLKCFENGEQILAYIEENQHPEILEQLQPVNLRKLAFEHKHYIYKRFEYFGSDGMRLSSDLEQDVTLEDIIERFLVTYQNPDSFYIDDDGEAAQNDKCLRTLDVLVRLMGKKELSGTELKIISDDFELCSKKEAAARFTIRALSAAEIRQRLYDLINEPLVSHFGLTRLQEIHELYQRDKAGFGEILNDIILRAYEDTPNDLLAVVPSLNQAEYAKGAQLLSVAYILSQESNGFFADPALEPLWAFYHKHLFQSCYRELENLNALRHSFDDEDRDRATRLIAGIKAYIDSQAKASGGLFARFMQQSAQEEQTDAAVSSDQALHFARELLILGEAEEDEEERTSLFVSDDIGMILASVLYAARVAKKPQKKQLLSLYELILQLFPSKTLLLSFIEFSSGDQFCSDATAEEVEAFCDVLSELKMDEKYVFLSRILVVHQTNEYEDDLDDFSDDNGLKRLYQTMLNIYRHKDEVDPDDPPMLAAREKKIAAAITAAVDLLNTESKEKFLSFI
ncbi:hypothetical protein L4174_009440 [Photobacterium sp. CCB-ST2H9]|uniref:hypothetical protein n=1 Tax=Photobacterium sp. CCB-ST2H9 TaxID=2912855 RepID=UPI002004E4F4|nr:hypothetical protein [Photobacterium sp. CCB-ST2H9]UTM56076.1 hypothetical protein L4174_009440 [Photobacterium sp. CCB-ST2H9]